MKKFLMSMAIAGSVAFGMSATALASGDLTPPPPPPEVESNPPPAVPVAPPPAVASNPPPRQLPSTGGSFGSPLLVGFTALIMGGGLVTIASQRRRTLEA